MKYRSVIASVLLSVGLLLLGIGCTNPLGNGDNGGDDPVITDPVVGFNVTGKVVDKDGKPVVGARAKLLNTGLSAITNVNGEYTIKGSGKISGKLSKRVAVVDTNTGVDTNTVVGTDTLVVTVANPENPSDSSEIVKTTVTSGVIDTLPVTYIVQREIAVPYVTADGIQIGRVEATVYDVSVPDIKKTIDLANDATRKAFTTFAYFSSEKNKNYVLYTMVYNVNGKFIGRSADYPFSDNYGNLSYATPFRCNNATPSVTVNATADFIRGQVVPITITAVDSFGGQVVSCEYDAGNKGSYVTASAGTLQKVAVSNKVVYTANITVPDSIDTFKVVIKTTDNDSNVSYDTLSKVIKSGKISFGNVNGTYYNNQTYTLNMAIIDDAKLPLNVDSAKYRVNNGEWKVTKYISIVCSDPTVTKGIQVVTEIVDNGSGFCVVEVEATTKIGVIKGSAKYTVSIKSETPVEK